jgi:CheY-like chemotaxis protein
MYFLTNFRVCKVSKKAVGALNSFVIGIQINSFRPHVSGTEQQASPGRRLVQVSAGDIGQNFSGELYMNACLEKLGRLESIFMQMHPVVLIVDDDESLRAVIKEFVCLICPGSRILEAANGQAGLTITQKMLPDLILLDFHMPVMNGYEMVMALQESEETATIPLVMCTSEDVGHPLLHRLRSLGYEVIFKPKLFDRLESTLVRLLLSHRLPKVQEPTARLQRSGALPPAALLVAA